MSTPSRANREGDSQPLPLPSGAPIAHHLVMNDIEGNMMAGKTTIVDLYESLLSGALLLKETLHSRRAQILQPPSFFAKVIRGDLEQRLQLGVSRYGQPLQPFNGRDSLLDAYEEVLDALVYLRTAIYEQEHADQAPPTTLQGSEVTEIETLKHMAESAESPVRRAEP